MISVLKSRKLLSSRCMVFMASIVDLSKERELMLDDVLVIQVYVSVFPKDLVRLPPDREIIFSIELVPGTVPFLQAPYRLTPVELKKLKV